MARFIPYSNNFFNKDEQARNRKNTKKFKADKDPGLTILSQTNIEPAHPTRVIGIFLSN